MNFWIFQDKPNKRIAIHRAECGTRNGRQGHPSREDRGTDRIPTTMRRSAKRKRCLHVKALKSTAAFAIRNTRPDNGTGSGGHPRPVSEKLSRHRLLLRPQRLPHGLRGWGGR